MKTAERAWKAGRTAALTTAVQAATMLLPGPDYSVHERRILMTKIAAAAEMQKDIRENTTPPARDPEIAVAEEYQMARQRGTVQALELFIARHPDSALAEKARADLRRLSR
jgi:hypothetical protein